jgi:hypothetical protein
MWWSRSNPSQNEGEYFVRTKRNGGKNNKQKNERPGGVAQWTSHLPQEQEDPGLNPARV